MLSGLSFKLFQFAVNIRTGHSVLQWWCYFWILKSITFLFLFFMLSRVFAHLTSVLLDLAMHH